jgi:hypothetical protein
MSAGRQHSACSPQAWSFGRVEEVWQHFLPLTPYGRDAREDRRVLADLAEIERGYDDTDAFAAHVSERSVAGTAGRVALDRLSYHLRRIPRLPMASLESGARLELVELFQIKKFLANYQAVAGLAGEALRNRFDLHFRSVDLAAELDNGGSDPETLYIASAMHPSLEEVRRAVAKVGAALHVERQAARQRAHDALGLDFGERDFLLVPNDQGRSLLGIRDAGVAVTVEAYDARSCLVRLQDGPAELLLVEELDRSLARERELEAEVIARLSELAAEEAGNLAAYTRAIGRLDLARARAVLATDLGLTRPRLGGGELTIEGGQFLPCKWDCERLDLDYTPLDLRLAESAAVLFGSNMGGKTVVLQTLVFLQTMAQAGLYVPARGYATSVYPWIGYVGELAAGRSEAALGGLSGFGFEMRSFVDSWDRARQGGAFLAFDEFARTTSSADAEALLSAVVEALAGLPGTRSLIATHFHGLARLPGVRYLTMLGLDRAGAAATMAADQTLAERIRRLNGLMRYKVVDESSAGATDEPSDGDELAGSDATVIAGMLGVDRAVLARAESFLAQRSGRGRTAAGGTNAEGS